MSSSLGRMMAGGAHPKSQAATKDNSFFPTKPEVTTALMRWAAGRFEHCIAEPFAGDGAMSRVLEEHGHTVISTDIAPRAEGILPMDFFELQGMKNCSTIISNPPFPLAERAIRHAFKIGCTHLALVLKSTFWHAAERTDFFYEHRPSHVLALNWRVDWLDIGRPTMEAVWVVWMPGTQRTEYDILRHPWPPSAGRRKANVRA